MKSFMIRSTALKIRKVIVSVLAVFVMAGSISTTSAESKFLLRKKFLRPAASRSTVPSVVTRVSPLKAGQLSSRFHSGSLLSHLKSPLRLTTSLVRKAVSMRGLTIGACLLTAGLLLPACGDSHDSDKQFSNLTVQNRTRRETLEIYLKASFGSRFYAGKLAPGQTLSHSFFVDGADTIEVEAYEGLTKELVSFIPVYLDINGAIHSVEDLQESAVQVFNQRLNDVVLEMDDLNSTTVISIVVSSGAPIYPVRGDRPYAIKVRDGLTGALLYDNPYQWFTGGQVDSPFPVVVN